MKIIFILLCILIGLLFISQQVKENFTDLDATFLAKYEKFRTFYNTFLTNWAKAVITSYGTSLPAGQPVGTPTKDQLNEYIQTLSKTKKKTFPPITDPLPSIKTTDELQTVQIPRDPQSVQNALDFMNNGLTEAHAGMKDALKDLQGFADYEPFEDICQQLQTCQRKQQAVNDAQMATMQQDLIPLFDAFASLQGGLDRNNALIATSKKIQDQAQSGSLLPKVPPRVSPYTIPKGSDTFDKMKMENPELYKEYDKKFPSLTYFGKYRNEINANLR